MPGRRGARKGTARAGGESDPGQGDRSAAVRRTRVGGHHFYAAVLVAGLVGRVTGSMAVFLIALAALLVAGYYAGDIRR